MKKIFWALWLAFRPIVGLFYSFQEHSIKIATIVLNGISIYMLFLLNNVNNYMQAKATNAAEYASGMAVFLGAFLGLYITMIISIYKGKANIDVSSAKGAIDSILSKVTNTSVTKDKKEENTNIPPIQ